MVNTKYLDVLLKWQENIIEITKTKSLRRYKFFIWKGNIRTWTIINTKKTLK